MDTEKQELNSAAKEIVKEFVIKKMVLLLTNPDGEQKIKEDKEILEKLSIQLSADDLQPFITAIRKTQLIDYETKQIKDGQSIEGYFAILADLFSESNDNMWVYYNLFAKVKLNKHNFSDFHYVNTALKLLDYTNWYNDSPNEETKQEIKNLYLSTINLNISREDKISNLNILQHDLEIVLNEEEKTELSKHIKHNIMELVDLIDQIRKTSLGVQPSVEEEEEEESNTLPVPPENQHSLE